MTIASKQDSEGQIRGRYMNAVEGDEDRIGWYMNAKDDDEDQYICWYRATTKDSADHDSMKGSLLDFGFGLGLIRTGHSDQESISTQKRYEPQTPPMVRTYAKPDSLQDSWKIRSATSGVRPT